MCHLDLATKMSPNGYTGRGQSREGSKEVGNRGVVVARGEKGKGKGEGGMSFLGIDQQGHISALILLAFAHPFLPLLPSRFFFRCSTAF